MKIKKIFISFLAVILLCIFVYKVFAVAPTENLEYPSSFSLEGGARKCTIVKDPFDENNTCIKLERTSATGHSSDATATWLEYNNNKKMLNYDIEGKISVKFRMYVEENTIFKVQFYGPKDGFNKEIISLYTDEYGAFKVGDHVLSANCHRNRWHDIEIIIDTDNSIACFYINGEAMFPIGNSSKLKFSTSDVDYISWFRFLIDETQFDKYVLLDDIKISPLEGMASVADVKDITMIADGQICNNIDYNAKNTQVNIDLRVVRNAPVMLIAAQYNQNGGIERICSSITTNSGSFSLDLGKISSDITKLKCFIWHGESLYPIGSEVFGLFETSADIFGNALDTDNNVRAILQMALDNMEDGAILHIPKGTYILSPDYGERYCLKLSGKKNIKIIGDESKFILKDKFSGFIKIGDCAGVEISGITVDYEIKPWEQGIVTKIDADNSSFVMKVSDNGGIFDAETFKNNITSCFMMVRNNETPRLINDNTNEHYLVTSVESIGNDMYRFFLNNWSAAIISKGILKENDKVIVNARGMSGSSFFISKSSDINLKDISVYASGECAIKGSGLLGDLYVNNFSVIPKDGHWVSTNADGVHLRFSQGKLVLKDSNFDSLSDDAVNLYQAPISIKSVLEKSVTVDSASCIKKGDILVIFNYENGCVKKEVAVESVDGQTVTFEEEIGEVSTDDVIYIKNEMFNDSVISGNTFSNLRRYGLLLKCSDIIISDNVFVNTGSDAVCAVYSSSEGLWLRNASFLNNQIVNSGYLRNGKQKKSGAFSIRAEDNAQSYIHSNITFSQNTIASPSKCGFYLESVNGVVLDDTNNIYDTPEDFAFVKINNCINTNIAEKFVQ